MKPADPKSDLLHRLRVALHGHTTPPAGSARPMTEKGTAENLEELFRRNLEEVGGVFLSSWSLAPILPALGEALRTAGVTCLLAPEGDPAACAVASALVPFGPFSIVDAQTVRQSAPPVAAGIQSAEFAVAETGTLVQTSRGGKTLLPGLIPDVHVAILSPDLFVAGMEEVLEALSGDLPRNVSFVTGPSRTGDIEQTLTIGAHGPKKVVALLLSQPPEPPPVEEPPKWGPQGALW